MMHPTINADGFLTGYLQESAVNQFNQSLVVVTPIFPSELPPLHAWRWQFGGWKAEPNYTGKGWYNPQDTDQEHWAARFDDAPPVGWVLWEDGQNKVALPAETLLKAKAERWAYVKRRREQAEFGGFVVDGVGTFDSDEASQGRIQGAVMAAQMGGPGFSITWTLADNSTAQLDGEQMIVVGITMLGHISNTHALGRVLRAEIEAATTLEDVQAVDW